MFCLLSCCFLLELGKALSLVLAASELSFLALDRKASVGALSRNMMACWHTYGLIEIKMGRSMPETWLFVNDLKYEPTKYTL